MFYCDKKKVSIFYHKTETYFLDNILIIMHIPDEWRNIKPVHT